MSTFSDASVEVKPLILVAGARGYVGTRLVSRLLAQGYAVRCLVRGRRGLPGIQDNARLEMVAADVHQPDSLAGALRQVNTAYYLIHSMRKGRDYHQWDMHAAANFAHAAQAAGVERIIYLGGLGSGQQLAEHLRSRQEVGQALRQAGIPVIEFRAAVIVGRGSLSFDFVHYVTERLSVMVCPRWIDSRTQPIAISDMLDYLIAALELAPAEDLIVEVGGADVLTYREMVLNYAELRGLKRLVVAVPVLPLGLMTFGVSRLTPIPAAIARPLMESLRSDSVVISDAGRRLFPDIQPVGYRQAVLDALASSS